MLTKKYKLTKKEQKLADKEFLFHCVYTQLSDHGRELHYNVIAKMIRYKYSSVFSSVKDRSILYILNNNPLYFKRMWDGVYKTIKY